MTAERVPGVVSGGVRLWLRIEGGAVLFAGALMYAQLDYSWTLFAVLFLLPDLSFAGYLSGPRLGAGVYNTMHSYAAPLVAAGVCIATGAMVAVPLIWIAHIGFDRALGYGLKYPTAFQHTHLGQIGRHPRT